MYQRIIQEVIECSLIDFEEAGVSAATLDDLKLVSEASKIAVYRFVLFLSLPPLSKPWTRWAIVIILLAIAWLTESPFWWERWLGFRFL